MTTAQLFQELVTHAVDQLTTPRTTCDERVALDTRVVLQLCGTLARQRWDSDRWRWQGHELARQAAAYLAHLQPPAGWCRTDLPGDPDEFALGWTDGDTVLVDVLATGGPTARLWTRHSSGMPRRLVRAGQAEHGKSFAGVRVVSPAAPGRSVLVTSPTGPPSPLVGTPVASDLESCATSTLDLLHAASGVVR